MPTKYDTLPLIHIFKTNSSKFFFKKNYDTRPKIKKKKASSYAQSACDATSKNMIFEKNDRIL